MTLLHDHRKAGPGRGELIGGWISAGVAIVTAVGVFLASDPGAGYESWVWFMAPVMLAASAAAMWIGRSAVRDGEAAGRWPAAIGFVVGGFFTFMLALALIAHLFGLE